MNKKLPNISHNRDVITSLVGQCKLECETIDFISEEYTTVDIERLAMIQDKFTSIDSGDLGLVYNPKIKESNPEFRDILTRKLGDSENWLRIVVVIKLIPEYKQPHVNNDNFEIRPYVINIPRASIHDNQLRHQYFEAYRHKHPLVENDFPKLNDHQYMRRWMRNLISRINLPSPVFNITSSEKEFLLRMYSQMSGIFAYATVRMSDDPHVLCSPNDYTLLCMKECSFSNS